ncbi:DUF6948 domain-containing protein [Pectobacterium versatile]|uniref:DUF6948 domain-containing protein n=1 Tax=Pectobacterium versatile TaxID=2488639 RepID=UPI001F22EE32|nr:hypothetical protein [Pectobacterium versatile]
MNINVNDLTIGQAKSLAALFGNSSNKESSIGNQFIGKSVIIRTYSAGVWFGVLSEKSGNEVIVKNARRMWRWQAKESISLSAVAKFGIDQSKSKIAPEVEFIWLEAIEIIPTTPEATALIEGAADVEAE